MLVCGMVSLVLVCVASAGLVRKHGVDVDDRGLSGVVQAPGGTKCGSRGYCHGQQDRKILAAFRDAPSIPWCIDGEDEWPPPSRSLLSSVLRAFAFFSLV